MAALSSIWSDLKKKKTSKVVRYEHPSEAQSSGGGAPPTPPNWFKVAASYQGVSDGTSKKVVKSMLVDAGAYVSQLAEKVSSLEQQLEHLQVDRDACNATMSSLHRDLSESRAALIIAQKTITNLQQCLLEQEEAAAIQHESLQMLKAEYTFASADKQRAQETIAQLVAEAEEAAETKQATLRIMREDLAAAKAGKAEAQQQAEDLAHKLAAAQSELQTATQQLQELQQQFEGARAEAKAHADAYAELETKLFLAEERACKAQDTATDLSNSLSTAQQALQQSEQQTHDLTAHLTDLSSQLSQQQADMQCAEGSNLEVQGLLYQAQDEGMQLSEQLSVVLHQLAEQQDARLAAEQSVAGLKLELKAMKDQHTQQLHELQKLQLHCDEMRLARSAALCSAAMLEQQLSSKDAELARQQELAAALSAQVLQQSTMCEGIVNGNLDLMLDSMYSQAKAAAAVAHDAGARSPQHWRPLRSQARSWPSSGTAAAQPAATSSTGAGTASAAAHASGTGSVVLPADGAAPAAASCTAAVPAAALASVTDAAPLAVPALMVRPADNSAAGAAAKQPLPQSTDAGSDAAGGSRASCHSMCTDHSMCTESEPGTDASELELLETDLLLQQAADKLQLAADAAAIPANAVPPVPHAELPPHSGNRFSSTVGLADAAAEAHSQHLVHVTGLDQHIGSDPQAVRATEQLQQDSPKDMACADSSAADTQSVADAVPKAPALTIAVPSPSLDSSVQLVSSPKDSAQISTSQSAAQGSSSSPRHSSGWSGSPRALLAHLRERMNRSPTAAGNSTRSSTASISLTDLKSPGRVPSPALAAAGNPNLPVFNRLFGTVYGKPAPVAPSPFSTSAANKTKVTGNMLPACGSAGSAGSARASMDRGPVSSTAGRYNGSGAAALRASLPAFSTISTGGARPTMQRTNSTGCAGLSRTAAASSNKHSGAGVGTTCVPPSPAYSYSSFAGVGGISRSNSMGCASSVCRITGGSSGGAVNLSTTKQAVSANGGEHNAAAAPAGYAAAANTHLQQQQHVSLGGSKAAPDTVALPVYDSATDKQHKSSTGGTDKKEQPQQSSSADIKTPAALPKMIIRLQSEGSEQHRPQTPPASTLPPSIQQPVMRSGGPGNSIRSTNNSAAFISRIPRFSSSGGGSVGSSVTSNSAGSGGGISTSSTLSERLKGNSRIPSYSASSKPSTSQATGVAPAGNFAGNAGQTQSDEAGGLVFPRMLSSLLVARGPSKIPTLGVSQPSAPGTNAVTVTATADTDTATGTAAMIDSNSSSTTTSNSSSMDPAAQQTSNADSARVIAHGAAPAPAATSSGQIAVMSAAVAFGTTRALQSNAARSNPASQGLCIRLAAQSAVTRGTAAAIAATMGLYSDSIDSRSEYDDTKNQPCSPTGSINSTDTSGNNASRKARNLGLASPKGLTPLSPMSVGFRSAKASPKGQNPSAVISPCQPGRMSPLPA